MEKSNQHTWMSWFVVLSTSLFFFYQFTQMNIINNIHVYSTLDYHRAMLIMPIAMIIALILNFFIRETYCQSELQNPPPTPSFPSNQ